MPFGSVAALKPPTPLAFLGCRSMGACVSAQRRAGFVFFTQGAASTCPLTAPRTPFLLQRSIRL